MQKFYDDVDPEMADVTLDELIDKLPASANWYFKVYCSTAEIKYIEKL